MIEKIKSYYKIIIFVVIVIILFSLIFAFEYYKNKNVKMEKKETKVIQKKKKEEVKEVDNASYVYVDIKGAVNSPGVYKLEEGKRVVDVINMAGGLIESADTSIINLSKKISDEMLIIIYTVDELKAYKEKLTMLKETNKQLEEKIICPDTSNDACISKETKKSTTKDELNTSSNSLISINTSTKDELMTLSGIGESKADAIIKYREENGKFDSIEDIKNVSGIGDALYEKIKDLITV